LSLAFKEAQQTRPDDGLPATPKLPVVPLLSAAVAGVCLAPPLFSNASTQPMHPGIIVTADRLEAPRDRTALNCPACARSLRMPLRSARTRLTNAFSKKPENFVAAIALDCCYFNFVKTHGAIRMTPAQAAGIENGAWTVTELAKR
jgi:hypothetical protein